MASSNRDLPRQWSLSTEEMWKEIVADTESQKTTLEEDFLTKDTTNMILPPQMVPSATKGGRGKKRVVEEQPLDKATLQKQRRMIKNRESAARSRERKQAYTIELESLVTHLEEENARLLREEADMKKQRFNQLMKCLIPVVEKRKPRQKLRRVNSAQW